MHSHDHEHDHDHGRSGGHQHTHKHRHGLGHKHDGAVFSIDYYAYASKIRDWNPVYKSLLALISLLLCILLNNLYVALAVLLAMSFLTVVKGGLSFDRYLSTLTIPLVFMIFGSVAIALGVAKNPVGQYNLNLGLFYIYCSRESVMKTLLIMGKAIGAVSAMYMLTLSTPASEIITVLRKAHIPGLFIEMMNMIYRYIFLLMDTQCRMKNSAVSRLGYVDFKTSMWSFGQVAANLLVVSLKKGTAYYQALESRCYDGTLRFLEEDKPVTKPQIILGSVFCLLLIALWLVTK